MIAKLLSCPRTLTSLLRPEAELLICCARTRMNSDTAERMLLLGLFLARAFLGAALPEEVVHRVHADPVVPSLGAQVGEWLFPDADSAGGGWESCFFHLKVRERLRDVVRFCLGMIMIPNGGDRYLCMTC
ncbi:MAG: hypothetical protein HY278_03515 [candidate division NC10 bacterium]|nr:hypothetical protein [candidate division NC10 bacterium]